MRQSRHRVTKQKGHPKDARIFEITAFVSVITIQAI
jgi:hypothetical protein